MLVMTYFDFKCQLHFVIVCSHASKCKKEKKTGTKLAF